MAVELYSENYYFFHTPRLTQTVQDPVQPMFGPPTNFHEVPLKDTPDIDRFKTDVLITDNLETKQHFTEPPARYTEAKLVAALDELGIGLIRDGFSDLFFPGTSTIQTRAKYFFIVPYALIIIGLILAIKLLIWLSKNK